MIGNNLFEEVMGRMYQESLLNMYETPDNWIIEIRACGVKKENLEITTDGSALLVKAKRPDDEKTISYSRKEFWRDQIGRRIEFPGYVDLEKTDAKLEDGILTIQVPKAKVEKKSKIEVH